LKSRIREQTLDTNDNVTSKTDRVTGTAYLESYGDSILNYDQQKEEGF
jgi:hypothetical protein